MKRQIPTLSSYLVGLSIALLATPVAIAENAPDAVAVPATAEVKAGTGYERYQVVGEAAGFPVGTLVFAVSRITGAEGTTVRHVWKLDGAEVWSASLEIGSRAWTTSSRRRMTKAGNYEVAVIGSDGSELGKVAFTVQ